MKKILQTPIFIALILIYTHNAFADFGFVSPEPRANKCESLLESSLKKAHANIKKGMRLYKAEAQSYKMDPQTHSDLKIASLLEPILDKTRTYYGQKRLQYLLQNPYLDVNEIKQRQEAVMELMQNQKLRKDLSVLMEELSQYANLSMSNHIDEYDEPYSDMSLSLLPVAILGGISSYAIYKHAPDVLSFSIYNLTTSALARPWMNLRSKLLHYRGLFEMSDDVAKSLETSKSQALNEVMGALLATSQLDHPHSLALTKKSLKSMSQSYIAMMLLQCLYAHSEWSLRKVQKQVIESKTQTSVLLSAIAELDVYLALAEYGLEHSEQKIFPEVLDSHIAQIKMEEAHNPYIYLEPKKSVANNVEISFGLSADPLAFSLEENKKSSFAVLTGPNAGGKSTYLRMIGMLSTQAQIGAPVPAKAFEFTPVEIMSNIEVNDSLEDGKSFFRAESNRLAKILKKIDEQPKLLVIMDEILLGTNPQDRLAIEKAVIERISKSRRLTLIATHDIQVTKLAQQDSNIQLLKVEEKKSENGIFDFTFRIIPGVSKISTAYQVLRAEGVPLELIERAQWHRGQMD